METVNFETNNREFQIIPFLKMEIFILTNIEN